MGSQRESDCSEAVNYPLAPLLPTTLSCRHQATIATFNMAAMSMILTAPAPARIGAVRPAARRSRVAMAAGGSRQVIRANFLIFLAVGCRSEAGELCLGIYSAGSSSALSHRAVQRFVESKFISLCSLSDRPQGHYL